MNRQNEMTAELIAQLVVAGVARSKIARSLDMTYVGLDRIMTTPEYQAIEDRIAARTKMKMEELTDARLEKRLALKVEVEDAVAEAIHVLLGALREKKDLRAALEILDRDPEHQFGKASRSQVETKAPSTISSAALADAVKEADITNEIMRAAEDLNPNETRQEREPGPASGRRESRQSAGESNEISPWHVPVQRDTSNPLRRSEMVLIRGSRFPVSRALRPVRDSEGGTR